MDAPDGASNETGGNNLSQNKHIVHYITHNVICDTSQAED